MADTKNPVYRFFRSRVLHVALFGAALAVFSCVFISGISGQADRNQIEFLENAIRRNAVQCYALEGRFPADIRYLEDNYALVIDRTRYDVRYVFKGARLIPEIGVFPAARI
jgi:hypothetical protein